MLKALVPVYSMSEVCMLKALVPVYSMRGLYVKSTSTSLQYE